MFNKGLLAAAAGGLVFLSACGGGGSSGTAPTPQGGDGTVTRQAVAGPLDPVQDQVSGSVISPLADATSGTPLEPVLLCADQVVVQDTLDIADSVLAQLQAAALSGGGVPMSPDPAVLTASLESLVVDLTGLLSSLGGVGSGCLTGSLTLEQIADGDNPLAGTPLEPLGAALQPVLAQIAAAIDSSDGSGEDLQLTTVSTLVTQLNLALQGGLAQIPADAYDAPIAGGVLTTVSTALDDTDDLLAAVAAYNAGGTQAELQNTLYNTLVNVLTQVVPVAFLEDQAGQSGVISGQIEAAAAQVSSTLASALGNVTTPVLSDVLADAAAPALDPIENQVLPAVIGPIIDALSGGGDIGAGDLGSVFAGTPLAPVIEQLAGALEGLLGGGLGGGLPVGGSCPLEGVPLLSVLCGLTGG